MNRRKALAKLAILSGGAIVTLSGMLQSCGNTVRKRIELTHDDIPLLDQIGETIIPTTANSPGALGAKIGAYMLAMVNDCYTEKRKKIFIEGLDTFEQACFKQYQIDFIKLTTDQKKSFVQRINEEEKDKSKDHYFSMMKSLTITGYVTSEYGATIALRHDPVPGMYHGCIPYEEGDKPWAST